MGVGGRRSDDFGTKPQIRIVNVLGPHILSQRLSWQMAQRSVPPCEMPFLYVFIMAVFMLHV